MGGHWIHHKEEGRGEHTKDLLLSVKSRENRRARGGTGLRGNQSVLDTLHLEMRCTIDYLV